MKDLRETGLFQCGEERQRALTGISSSTESSIPVEKEFGGKPGYGRSDEGKRDFPDYIGREWTYSSD